MDVTAPERSSLWRRIATFPLSLIILGTLILGSVAAGLSAALRRLQLPRNSPAELVGGLCVVAAFILAYKAYKRWVERAPDTELPLSGAFRELGLGLLAGFVLFSIVVGVVMLAGGLQIVGVRWPGDLWTMLLIATASGVMEEAVFRGVILRHLETMIGSIGALGITSALFGAQHIGNPHASWFAAAAIAVEAGVLLAAAFMLTRRLWLAIGLHAAWNFTQGGVFSVPISGTREPVGLLVTRRTGPEWLTGGEFGLEASVVAMVVATLAGGVLLWRVWKAGQLRPPMWRRSTSANP